MPPKRRQPSAPSAARSEHKKEEIISAAQALFARKTFSGTSVREIARAARVNVASIYYYFGDKNGLQFAVLDRAYAGLHSAVEKTAPISDPRERLKNLLDETAAFLAKDPTTHRIMVQAGFEGTPEIEKVIRVRLRKTRLLINQAIEEGIDLGVFRRVNVEVFSFGLMSALMGFFSSRFLFVKLFAGNSPVTLFDQSLPFPIWEMTLRGLSLSNRDDKKG
jgi:AcrR family transcriptional regulator